jgi:hypothetical protein
MLARCPSHDLEFIMAVRRRKHNPGSPGKLARSVAVAQQSLKLGAFGAIGGAKVKAYVEAFHAPNIACQAAHGNLLSGGEH